MTTVDRHWLHLSLTVAMLVFVAAAFAGLDPVSSSVFLFPVIVAIESAVYFIVLMVTNPRATIGMAAGGAMVLAIMRGLCSLVGGIVAHFFRADVAMEAILQAWVNPLTVIIQVALLLMAAPYVLAAILPDLLGEVALRELEGTPSAKSSGPSRGAHETAPAGGFIPVTSYEELAAVVKKGHGIEGFIIISSEGLVVWKDFPLRVDLDAFVARFAGHAHGISGLMEQTGLTKVRRVMVESREHFFFTTTLNQNFGLILIFNGRVSAEEVTGRVPVIAKTCREFLQWKYPALPARNFVPRETPLETA